MQGKLFKKNDEGFICENCGSEVPPLSYSSRDHCSKCLCSKHVDINPGDRENECGGLLVPVSSRPDPKKGFIIEYECKKCKKHVRCKAAADDDTELLIALTVANK